MAFVSRSKKETLGYLHERKHTLGPGTYNPKPVATNPRISYAPFASSAERGGFDFGNNFTPGPGDYATDLMAPVPQASVTSSGFISRVTRFGHSVNGVPGPGSYKAQQSFKPPKPLPGQPGSGAAAAAGSKPPAGADSGVQWVRVSAPPSIPTTQQSYGYEESADGDLVLQNAPREGYSGVAADKPGPGVYDPNPAVFKKRATVLADFGRTGGDRYSHLPSKSQLTVPGVGMYNPTEARRRGTKKPSASFTSTVKRWGKQKKTTITPGPGYYYAGVELPPRPEDRPPQTAPAAAFGSTQTRVLTTAPPSLIANPGPGTYKRPDTWKAKPVTDGLDAANSNARIAFHATADRFAPPKAGAAPGPGFYSALRDIKADLDKKTFGRNESFGATSVRFFDMKQSDPSNITGGSSAVSVPGPGTYDHRTLIQDVAKAKDARRPAASFASTNPRFNPKQSTQIGAPASSTGSGSGLAPGQYDAPIPSSINTDSGARVRPSPAFLQSSNAGAAARDPIPARQSLESAHLGPGRYSASDPRHKPTKTVSSSFRDTKPRFNADNGIYANRGNAGAAAPGPGMYSEPNDRSSSLIKRSFNITIAS